ncbi:unnamed protein product [Haemonchus placei]|uniref:G protein-coupled receptor n=1 Tax=Haemonchus placei TaxID=6290 RepID=A0A0N4WWF1_HAEPC|nr:unnamed protein product [Haemonchus placei]
MITCHLQSEPEAFFTTMHILSAITLPVDLFGVYCIVKKSPPFMKDYSRLLLVYQICATVTDTFTNMLFIPVAFFPFPVVYHAGVLFSYRYLKYSYMFITWLCLVVTTMGAIVQLFVFRWQSLLMNDHPLRLDKKYLILICSIMFVVTNGAVVIAGFSMPNRREELRPIYIQVMITMEFKNVNLPWSKTRLQLNKFSARFVKKKLFTFKEFSCIAELVDQPGIQYFLAYDYRRLLLVVCVEGLFVILVSFILVYLTFRNFRFTNVTQKTIDLQKRYQKSLIVQVNLVLLFC